MSRPVAQTRENLGANMLPEQSEVMASIANSDQAYWSSSKMGQGI